MATVPPGTLALMSEPPRKIRTRHAELSLEEIAGLLPGTGEVMRSVGGCYAMSWHAAHGGNWELAMYYLRRVRSLLRGLALSRPKYEAQIREFDAEFLEPAYRALVDRDLWSFDARYESATDQANAYHLSTGHPYIRWVRPEAPPETGLDLTLES